MSIGNLGAANLLNNKNDQIRRERARSSRVNSELQDTVSDLQSAFNALSRRNDRLEALIASMTDKGVASEALGTIHTLKAEALQKRAQKEVWGIEKRRAANLKLAAEAEYDYRLKNDPSYRLNVADEALMKAAEYSENGDMIRKTVAQMYATGKVRQPAERDNLIKERIVEMRVTARYESNKDTVPMPNSILPAKLESDEPNQKEYDTFSQVRLNKTNSVWVR